MAMPNSPLHASAVAYFGRALLILGESGQGKSSLALTLIQQHGFMLVGDDQILLESEDKHTLLVKPAPALASLLEVRGLGIMRMPYRCQAAVVAVLSLDPPYPRMPDFALPEGSTSCPILPGSSTSCTLAGITLPLIHLDPKGPALANRALLALNLDRLERFPVK
jgi:HPr kinase/phosphorylase